MSKQEQHDDDIQGKALDMKLLRRLLGYLKPYRVLVGISTLLMIAVSSLGSLRPYLTKIAVDEQIANKDAEGLLQTIMIIFGVLVTQGFLQYGLTQLMQRIGQSTILDLRVFLFSRLQELSLRFYDKNPVGRLVTRVTSDVDVLNEVFSSGIVMIVSDIFVILWIIAFMLKTNVELTFVSIATLPLLLYATAVFRRKVRATYRDVRRQIARMNSFLNEFISGITIVQLFSQEKKQHERFDKINKDHADAQVKSIFYYAVFFPVVEGLSTIAVALTLWYAAGHILEGAMTLGMLIAFTQYFEMFFRPIRDLSEKYNTLQNAMVSSERIFTLIDEDSFVRDNPNAVPMKKLEREIEFRDVHFSYDDKTPILKGVSFTVKKGQMVALVGATGAGKSSIISLLSRFYEFQEGQILIDGADIRSIQQKSLRAKIAVVLQDVFLFSRSIAENISLENPEVTPEKIRLSARAVGAGDFIEELPLGYDSQVMERGATLSVGQKQLISFARALATDPDILILDEATSSVDTATERLIEKAVQTLLAGRTSIVVAHRLSTIQRADKILVLHHGEVREEGAHEELLAKNGLYAKLYRLQYKEQMAPLS